MKKDLFFKLKPGEARVRMAPSPTGFLHLGTARSSLFNYLFAKKYQGTFVLRIEDTDLERSDLKYEKDIIEGLRWLGLIWDEGVEIGGKYSPYRQTERLPVYEKYIKQLLDENKAYYCFCSKEELEAEKNYLMSQGLSPKYPGRCRQLSEKEIKNNFDAGKSSIIRLHLPEKIVKFSDLIRGYLSFDSSLIGDIAIAKSLNTPLYNFAVVVDDFEMKITHVIRGDDHLSNTPKQILIQEALGFSAVQYLHLPMILGADKSKLSKRHGATSILEYKNQGYLPEAMINFLALLGWNPGTEKEIFSLEELIKEFSIEKLQKSGAVFNIQKLDWLNSHYIKQKNLKELVQLCLPYFDKEKIKGFNDSQIEKIIALEQGRIKKLSEIAEVSEFFFKEKLDYDKNILFWKDMKQEELKRNLEIIKKEFTEISDEDFNFNALIGEEGSKQTITTSKINESLDKLAKEFGTGAIFWPLRTALSGQKSSPPPEEIAMILGKVKTLKRIDDALAVL